MAQEIDYKYLLQRYMAHVYDAEMDTFVFGVVGSFTKDEIAELDRMSETVVAEDTKYKR